MIGVNNFENGKKKKDYIKKEMGISSLNFLKPHFSLPKVPRLLFSLGFLPLKNKLIALFQFHI